MSDFGSILKNGKKRFEIKDSNRKWDKCEACEKRAQVYPYKDSKNETWMLCNSCIDIFVKDEGK